RAPRWRLARRRTHFPLPGVAPMLDANLKTQLQAYLERLTRPVHLVASLDDADSSKEMLELLQDIEGLSPQVSLEVRRDDAERKPSFAITSPGQDINLRFAGLPMGHEFTSLVLALLQVGGHPSKAAADVIAQVKSREGRFRVATVASLSCEACADVAWALNPIAVLHANFRHVAIDGALFQEEVGQRQVMSVRAMHLSGGVFAAGRMGLEEVGAKLD